MKNNFYLLYLVSLAAAILIQGEASGQISTDTQTVTTSLTTIAAQEPQKPSDLFLIPVIIFLIIIAYAAKRYL